MYFTEQFGVTRTDQDDWFDVILNTDTKLFVDPFLIFQDGEAQWVGAHDRLIEHFNVCFRLISEGNRNPVSVPYRKALTLLRFPEPREFCLGYTEVGTQGAGGGRGYAELIASAMSDAITRGLEDLRHFEELGVLNEGIGPDRISDLTCNVLRREFIGYTKAIVMRHGIPTSRVTIGGADFDHVRQAWRPATHDLPSNPYNGQPVLLVPERFLARLPVLNANDWWDNYQAEQLRNDMNYHVMRNVPKREIVAAARRNPGRVRHWAEEREQQPAVPYDFTADPAGVVQWLRAAQEYVGREPITIDPPADDAAFTSIIELVIYKFRHFVEEQGGWRLLWNDGNTKEKPEDAAQLLFKGVAQSYCGANNIVLDREVELGRGPVDFKFSNGYHQRALVEIKKLHNTKFWNGLTQQLPSYLRSDNCRLGWYVPIRYKEDLTSRTWASQVPSVVAAATTGKNLDLRVLGIDARPKPSASKL